MHLRIHTYIYIYNHTLKYMFAITQKNILFTHTLTWLQSHMYTFIFTISHSLLHIYISNYTDTQSIRLSLVFTFLSLHSKDGVNLASEHKDDIRCFCEESKMRHVEWRSPCNPPQATPSQDNQNQPLPAMSCGRKTPRTNILISAIELDYISKSSKKML